jgi:hypothetical protein
MPELAHQELGVLLPGLQFRSGGAVRAFSDPVPRSPSTSFRRVTSDLGQKRSNRDGVAERKPLAAVNAALIFLICAAVKFPSSSLPEPLLATEQSIFPFGAWRIGLREKDSRLGPIGPSGEH